MIVIIILCIIIILILVLIYNNNSTETFQTRTLGWQEACNELTNNRIKLAVQITTLRNPNQNIVTTMNEAYDAKNENMNYQYQFTQRCKDYLSLADGDPQKEACKLLASVDKYEFPVLSDLDVYNFNLLSSEDSMTNALNTLNYYANMLQCPTPPGDVSATYNLQGASNCLLSSGGHACTNTFVTLNDSTSPYTGNISNITVHKYNDPNQRQFGQDSNVNIYRDIAQINTQQLAYNLERLSPYYLSPDLLQYLLNFLISQDNLQYLAYNSSNFATAERCALYGITHPGETCPI